MRARVGFLGICISQLALTQVAGAQAVQRERPRNAAVAWVRQPGAEVCPGPIAVARGVEIWLRRSRHCAR
jgi:hypothetical protein